MILGLKLLILCLTPTSLVNASLEDEFGQITIHEIGITPAKPINPFGDLEGSAEGIFIPPTSIGTIESSNSTISTKRTTNYVSKILEETKRNKDKYEKRVNSRSTTPAGSSIISTLTTSPVVVSATLSPTGTPYKTQTVSMTHTTHSTSIVPIATDTPKESVTLSTKRKTKYIRKVSNGTKGALDKTSQKPRNEKRRISKLITTSSSKTSIQKKIVTSSTESRTKPKGKEHRATKITLEKKNGQISSLKRGVSIPTNTISPSPKGSPMISSVNAAKRKTTHVGKALKATKKGKTKVKYNPSRKPRTYEKRARKYPAGPRKGLYIRNSGLKSYSQRKVKRKQSSQFSRKGTDMESGNFIGSTAVRLERILGKNKS